MALYIQTNVASLNAQSNLSKTQTSLQTSFARLSSGYRINSAADDAAGLGISDSMTAQIRSYGVAERNSNDGISMATTADGAAGQITGMLQRMRELSVQSANGSLQSADRDNIDTEFQALVSEVDRIATSTKFNNQDLLSSSAAKVTFQVGIGTTSGTDTIDIDFSKTKMDTTTLGINASKVTGTDATNATAAITAIDGALGKVSTARASLGAAVNRFQTTVANIQSMKTNLSAANSRIRDVDVAEETAAMAKQQVLSQAGAAVLAQANQAPQLALGLLRG